MLGLIAFAAAESDDEEVLVVTAIDRAAELVDALSDEELADRIESALFLGWAEIFVGRFDDADRHLERGVNLVRASGQGQHILMTTGRALVLSIRGQISEATDMVATAVEIARFSGNIQVLAWALDAECRVATARGDLDTAVRCGEEGVAAAAELGNPWISAPVARPGAPGDRRPRGLPPRPPALGRRSGSPSGERVAALSRLRGAHARRTGPRPRRRGGPVGPASRGSRQL